MEASKTSICMNGVVLGPHNLSVLMLNSELSTEYETYCQLNMAHHNSHVISLPILLEREREKH